MNNTSIAICGVYFFASLLILSCTSESNIPQKASGEIPTVIQKDTTISDLSKVEPKQRLASAKKDIEKPNSSFVLSKEKRYVPNVESCLYIRSQPILADSTIIQCLIPIKHQEFVSEMWHELIPTGREDGDWAEFSYSFEIYTFKPDQPHDENMEEWLAKRKKVHDQMKARYRTFRNIGWIKYRDNDGTLNIDIKKDGG